LCRKRFEKLVRVLEIVGLLMLTWQKGGSTTSSRTNEDALQPSQKHLPIVHTWSITKAARISAYWRSMFLVFVFKCFIRLLHGVPAMLAEAWVLGRAIFAWRCCDYRQV